MDIAAHPATRMPAGCPDRLQPDEPFDATMILFRSATLAVRAHRGRGDRHLCFVVFDPMGEDTGLDREAFGEAFLSHRGIDAVHVLSARNNWYQDPDLPEALAQVRTAVAPYDRVVAYGSSMGGYAALRFSDRIGAHAVVAISPQYSLLPDHTAFEPRWVVLRRQVEWLYEKPGDVLPPVPDAVVFFDPHGLDRFHVAAILRDLPQARTVSMPHAGHPVGAMLSEIGVLPSSIIEAAEGRLDITALAATLRRQRHRSGQYLFTLARRQPLRRLALKAQLARRALLAEPRSPAYLSYAGLIADLMGDSEEALRLHAEAIRGAGLGAYQVRYAAALCRAGRFEAARAAAREALLRLPDDQVPVELKAVAAGGRTPAEALSFLARSPVLGLPRRHLAKRAAHLSRLCGRWLAGEQRPGWRLVERLIRRAVCHPRFRHREIGAADAGERLV